MREYQITVIKIPVLNQ